MCRVSSWWKLLVAKCRRSIFFPTSVHIEQPSLSYAVWLFCFLRMLVSLSSNYLKLHFWWTLLESPTPYKAKKLLYRIDFATSCIWVFKMVYSQVMNWRMWEKSLVHWDTNFLFPVYAPCHQSHGRINCNVYCSSPSVLYKSLSKLRTCQAKAEWKHWKQKK